MMTPLPMMRVKRAQSVVVAVVVVVVAVVVVARMRVQALRAIAM
jgi:hypothetical protein